MLNFDNLITIDNIFTDLELIPGKIINKRITNIF